MAPTVVARRFEAVRYRLYDLGQRVVGAVRRPVPPAGGSRSSSPNRSVVDWRAVLEAVDRGQVRIRSRFGRRRWTPAALIDRVRAVIDVARPAGVAVVVNDRADVAAATGADGVHLGQDDLPVEDASRVVAALRSSGQRTRSRKRHGWCRRLRLRGHRPIRRERHQARRHSRGPSSCGRIHRDPSRVAASGDRWRRTGQCRCGDRGGRTRVAVCESVCGADAPAEVVAGLRLTLARRQAMRTTTRAGNPDDRRSFEVVLCRHRDLERDSDHRLPLRGVHERGPARPPDPLCGACLRFRDDDGHPRIDPARLPARSSHALAPPRAGPLRRILVHPRTSITSSVSTTSVGTTRSNGSPIEILGRTRDDVRLERMFRHVFRKQDNVNPRSWRSCLPVLFAPGGRSITDSGSSRSDSSTAAFRSSASGSRRRGRGEARRPAGTVPAGLLHRRLRDSARRPGLALEGPADAGAGHAPAAEPSDALHRRPGGRGRRAGSGRSDLVPAHVPRDPARGARSPASGRDAAGLGRRPALAAVRFPAPDGLEGWEPTPRPWRRMAR